VKDKTSYDVETMMTALMGGRAMSRVVGGSGGVGGDGGDGGLDL
jgi:hypothetical protein